MLKPGMARLTESFEEITVKRSVKSTIRAFVAKNYLDILPESGNKKETAAFAVDLFHITF